MLTEKMEKALNDQSNAEMYSAYLYLAMSAYFESISLKGFSNWMMVQAQEEMTHAMKFYNFINERGGRVVLKAIDAPPKEWANPHDVFEAVLEHEKKVTGLINSLVDLAIEEHDHASNTFLQWFVSEQVEEEDNANEVLQKIRLIGDARGNIFLLDRELGARIFSASSQSSEE